MNIETIIEQVAEIQGASSALKALGLKRAFTDAQESLPEVPAIINTPSKAKRAWPATSGLRSVEHELNMQLFVSRSDLPTADRQAKQFIGAMFDLFDANVSLGGNATAAGVTAYEHGHAELGGVNYLTVLFTLTVTEKTRVAYQA